MCVANHTQVKGWLNERRQMLARLRTRERQKGVQQGELQEVESSKENSTEIKTEEQVK